MNTLLGWIWIISICGVIAELLVWLWRVTR